MLHTKTPLNMKDAAACVDAAIARVGKHIRLGMPVGLGKPVDVANAFVERALRDSSIQLSIYTALSLTPTPWRTSVDRRLIEPMNQRLFGNYPTLEYVRLRRAGKLPPNIEVIEFYVDAGAWLNNASVQQDYLSANYSHVARDLVARGINVIAQLVAPPPRAGEAYSLSCNPDLTPDILNLLDARSARDSVFLIGQVHRELPYMYGDALVAPSEFDVIIDEPDYPLFAPPNLPVGTIDYAIGLNVSALIRDGGTLQIGIGELGDAIVYALELRHRNNAAYRKVIAPWLSDRVAPLVDREGGLAPFEAGVYGCSEMLADGFLDLYRAGILKRKAFDSEWLQSLSDAGQLGSVPSLATLEHLSALGCREISNEQFAALQRSGLFAADVRFESGELVRGEWRCPARMGDADVHHALAVFLGARWQGALLHAGFFVAPRAFYAALREMPEQERELFQMRAISFVNELIGPDAPLRIAQRRHARFVNTTMMMTGLGAAVSDALGDGRVVSGVGGQYNFVAMAHALPDARSILCLRSTREAQGTLTSNLLWNYDHVTIPRHLRDIVITEYGIADLRGKSDREVVEAMIDIMDARFVTAFVRSAQAALKLPRDYRVPERVKQNMPEVLQERFATARREGLFGRTPFGSDLTSEEIDLARALKYLAAQTASGWKRTQYLLRSALQTPDTRFASHLTRMNYKEGDGWRERIEARALAMALREVSQQPF